ncbi:MAG TPA: hypothetical protein VII25_06350 [Candidatus Acidoferrum sp.]
MLVASRKENPPLQIQILGHLNQRFNGLLFTTEISDFPIVRGVAGESADGVFIIDYTDGNAATSETPRNRQAVKVTTNDKSPYGTTCKASRKIVSVSHGKLMSE